MTFILGWKLGHYSYVVADTALTLKRPTRQESERVVADRTTSFGELNVCEPLRAISESVLKLINLDQLAVAFCGDTAAARSVIETLAVDLRRGMLPRKALVYKSIPDLTVVG